MSTINAYDGFRVVVLPAQEDRLYLEFRADGNCLFVEKVDQQPSTPEGDIQLERTRIVLESICRYLNSGGDLGALLKLLRGGSDFVNLLESYRLEFPADLTCIGFGLAEDGSFQSYFHNTQHDTYLVVEEDSYSEELNPAEMLDSFIATV